MSSGFTDRQVECLTLASYGELNKDIAARLYVVEPTVVFHLAGARKKLGARNTAHAVRLGIEQGILSLTSPAPPPESLEPS